MRGSEAGTSAAAAVSVGQRPAPAARFDCTSELLDSAHTLQRRTLAAFDRLLGTGAPADISGDPHLEDLRAELAAHLAALEDPRRSPVFLRSYSHSLSGESGASLTPLSPIGAEPLHTEACNPQEPKLADYSAQSSQSDVLSQISGEMDAHTRRFIETTRPAGLSRTEPADPEFRTREYKETMDLPHQKVERRPWLDIGEKLVEGVERLERDYQPGSSAATAGLPFSKRAKENERDIQIVEERRKDSSDSDTFFGLDSHSLSAPRAVPPLPSLPAPPTIYRGAATAKPRTVPASLYAARAGLEAREPSGLDVTGIFDIKGKSKPRAPLEEKRTALPSAPSESEILRADRDTDLRQREAEKEARKRAEIERRVQAEVEREMQLESEREREEQLERERLERERIEAEAEDSRVEELERQREAERAKLEAIDRQLAMEKERQATARERQAERLRQDKIRQDSDARSRSDADRARGRSLRVEVPREHSFRRSTLSPEEQDEQIARGLAKLDELERKFRTRLSLSPRRSSPVRASTSTFEPYVPKISLPSQRSKVEIDDALKRLDEIESVVRSRGRARFGSSSSMPVLNGDDEREESRRDSGYVGFSTPGRPTSSRRSEYRTPRVSVSPIRAATSQQHRSPSLPPHPTPFHTILHTANSLIPLLSSSIHLADSAARTAEDAEVLEALARVNEAVKIGLEGIAREAETGLGKIGREVSPVRQSFETPNVAFETPRKHASFAYETPTRPRSPLPMRYRSPLRRYSPARNIAPLLTPPKTPAKMPTFDKDEKARREQLFRFRHHHDGHVCYGGRTCRWSQAV